MSELLRQIRARAKNIGRAPEPAEIEEMANFRERGGLTRCLAALQAVAQEAVDTPPFPRDALALHLFEKLEKIDDGDGEPPIYVASAAELRKALASFRP